jgi:hypothetical protein
MLIMTTCDEEFTGIQTAICQAGCRTTIHFLMA